MLVSTYNKEVSKDHKSAIVRKWFLTYSWFWFTTQALFGIAPADRRPYTFIFRDEVYQHPVRSIIIILLVTGLLVWGTLEVPWLIVIGILYGFLWGHLVWNKDYVPNEQEDPQYLGKCNKKEE